MKYILLVLFCFSVAGATAQINDSVIKKNMATLDSQTNALNESIKANMHRIDSMNMARTNEQMSRNMDAFMAQRREQEKKNMQRMYWRIAFGVLMLVVLVVGMMRKKKQKQVS